MIQAKVKDISCCDARVWISLVSNISYTPASTSHEYYKETSGLSVSFLIRNILEGLGLPSLLELDHRVSLDRNIYEALQCNEQGKYVNTY